MITYLQTVLDLVAAHQLLVYGLVFLFAYVESVAIFGYLVPGSTLIVLISTLVPSGAIALGPMMGCAIVGAILGDGTSYWMGWRHRDRLVRLWPFTRHPQLLANGESYFGEHGGKSVFLGRFTPPVRGIVPMIAGMVRLPLPRFLVASVLSALLWAPVHILPGVLLGASLSLAGAVAGRLAVLLILLVAMLWLAVWTGRYLLRRGVPHLAAAQERLRDWAHSHDSWSGQQLRALLDPDRPEARVLAALGLLLVGALWAFFGVLEDVLTGDPLVRADTAVYHFLRALHTGWANRLMIGLTELGDGVVTTAVTLAVTLWLAVQRRWHSVAYWIGAVGAAAFFTVLIKLALHLPRPVAGLYSGWWAYSFPSGHATVNATLYGFLAVLVARELGPRWRAPVIGLLASLITLIAFSRLYLGAHWLSDVLGGFAFSLAWVALLGLVYLAHDPPRLHAAGLLAVAMATLLVAGGWHIARQYHSDRARYALRSEIAQLPAAAWWDHAWRTLPARRFDLGGAYEEPFNLQWAGNLATLRARLLAHGWRSPATWDLQHLLGWLAPQPDPLALPVLPKLHDGHQPAIMLVHAAISGHALGARQVLRIWASGIALQSVGSPARPLWLGTAIREQLYRPLGLTTVALEKPNWATSQQLLVDALALVRIVHRPVPPDGRWGGEVVLGHDKELIVTPSTATQQP